MCSLDALLLLESCRHCNALHCEERDNGGDPNRCIVPDTVRQRALDGDLCGKSERQFASAGFPCPDILDFLRAILPGRPFVLPGQKVDLDCCRAPADLERPPEDEWLIIVLSVRPAQEQVANGL